MSIHTRRLRTGRTSYDVKLRAPDGRQYGRTFRTRKEAEAYQSTERAAHLAGSWIDPEAGTILLSDYVVQWLALRPTLRPRTVELYEYLLRLHVLPGLGELALRAITTARIRTWHARLLTEHGVSRSTAAKAYRLLRSILATAFEDELLTRNPCVLRGAGAERAVERPVVSLRVVGELADTIESRYRAMVLMAVWTGLRFGEAAGLERGDIDLADQTVRIERQLQELKDGSHVVGPPKSEAGRRMIAIPPHVVPELERHLQAFVAPGATSRVFTSPDGGPLRRSNFNRRVWQRACAATKVTGLRFHDLRHTGNTLAASTGASTRELMARMGHSSARAALIYQHATLERDRSLADALTRLAEGGTQPGEHLRIDANDPAQSRMFYGSSIFGPSSRHPRGVKSVVPDRRRNSCGGDDGTRTHDPLLAKQVL
jgi:integrase